MAASAQVQINATNYTSLGAAIAAASGGETLNLTQNITEGLITVNKAGLTIDGGGFTVTSTSSSYGFEVESAGITFQDITDEMAGTFGIHSVEGADNLTLSNLTTNNNGGTGIALNCTNELTLTDVTSTNNRGNGISLTNCQNVMITNITTSGNEFSPGGFGAGVGVFNTMNFCPLLSSSNVVIGGEVNISERFTFYQQASGGGATTPDVTTFTPVPGSSTPANTHEVIFSGGGGTFGFPSLIAALTFAADAIASSNNSALTQAVTSVQEIASGDSFVRANLSTSGAGTVTLSIQAAISAAAAGTTVHVEGGDYMGQTADTAGKNITLKIDNSN